MRLGFRTLALVAVWVAASAPAPLAAQTVNGCDLATSLPWYDVDAASREITFVFPAYSPPCVVVRLGQSVTFSGAFSGHPLAPGTVDGMTITPDPESSIVATTSGSSTSFEFLIPGVDPFYCQAHFTSGMYGAVFVALFADGFEDSSFCDWSVVSPASACPP